MYQPPGPDCRLVASAAGRPYADLAFGYIEHMSESIGGSSEVTFEFKGETWVFPARVVEIQRRWDAAHEACTRLAEASDPDSVAAYRAACERRMAATHEKLDDPWVAALGLAKHKADTALRACAAAE
jgi:hypothetical protein